MNDNIERYRGDTYPITANVATRKGAVNIDGWSFVFSVSLLPTPATDEYVFQLTGVIDDAASGTVHFDMTEQQANLLGDFYYDIQVTFVGGKTRTIKKGKISFAQDITK